MKKLLYFLVFISSVYLLQAANISGFIPNNGQITHLYNNKKCNFYLSTDKITQYFFDNGFVYLFSKRVNEEKLEICKIGIEFLGCNQDVEILSIDKNDIQINYFNNHGSFKVNTYNKIRYHDIYDNIDIEFYEEEGKIKYDIIVKNGGDLSDVKLKIDKSININIENNVIEYSSLFASISESIPYSYYLNNSNIPQIKYNVDANIISFKGENLIKNDVLVVDPEVTISSYFGGNSVDVGRGVDVDSQNNAYISGSCMSSNIALNGFLNKKNADFDMFLIKLSPDGDIIWATFIGGANVDHSIFCKVDLNDDVWIGGETRGDFPTTSGAIQSEYNGGSSDAALVKVSKDGEVLYSTHYGGDSYDTVAEFDFDPNNNIWVSGRSISNNLYTTNDAWQKNTNNGYDAFVLKLTEDGAMDYATLIAYEIDELSEGIACDDEGNAYVSGYSNSPSFEYDIGGSHKGEFDGFVVKFNPNGEKIWALNYGETKRDILSNIAVGKNHFAISGYTNSSNLTHPDNVYQKDFGGMVDHFVAVFDLDGNKKWSTYVGGNGLEGNNEFITSFNDQGGGIEFNDQENLLVALTAESRNMKCSEDAYQPNNLDRKDAFIIEFAIDGDMLYASYFGGGGDEFGYDVSYASDDTFYLIGKTNCKMLDVIGNAIQKYPGNEDDAFYVKFGKGIPDCHETEFNYPPFDNSLNYIKDAELVSDATYLTKSEPDQIGAIWHNSKVPVAKGFTTTFSFSITDGVNNVQENSYPGADGIAFLVQNYADDTYGWNGGGLGFKTIPNALAVEFDLFHNSKLTPFVHDPNGNHIAVFTNGRNPIEVDHNKQCLLGQNTEIIEILGDGTQYYGKIEYAGEMKLLKIYINDNAYFDVPELVIEDIDLANLLNLTQEEFAYVGFTSATGDCYQNHIIHSWEFCPWPTSTVISSVDENITEAQSAIAYPNPFSGIVNISFNNPQSGHININIYDLYGQEIAEIHHGYLAEGSHEFVWNPHNLPTGQYYLRFSSAKYNNIIKLVNINN